MGQSAVVGFIDPSLFTAWCSLLKPDTFFRSLAFLLAPQPETPPSNSWWGMPPTQPSRRFSLSPDRMRPSMHHCCSQLRLLLPVSAHLVGVSLSCLLVCCMVMCAMSVGWRVCVRDPPL